MVWDLHPNKLAELHHSSYSVKEIGIIFQIGNSKIFRVTSADKEQAVGILVWLEAVIRFGVSFPLWAVWF